MPILLIDNYDSFAHNLARYLRRLGHSPEIKRNDAVTPEEVAKLKPTAIVISPGPGTPEEAGNCINMVRRFGNQIPILGICLGHQIIASAWGARIVRAPTPVHGISSFMHHSGQGVFSGLANPLQVGRYHSLVVDPESLPKEFKSHATTDDGVIMAIQHVRLPVVGFQFHPESVLTECGYVLLAAYLKLVGLRLPADIASLQQSDLPTVNHKAENKHASGGHDNPGYPITF